MIDRTPADAWFHDYLVEHWGHDDVLAWDVAHDIGRRLAARLREHADFGDPDDIIAKDMLAAAAYLDAQPQDRPATCPTCRGTWKAPFAGYVSVTLSCTDSWHHPVGTGDTR